jgi:hypothetical protein
MPLIINKPVLEYSHLEIVVGYKLNIFRIISWLEKANKSRPYSAQINWQSRLLGPARAGSERPFNMIVLSEFSD